MRKNRLCPLLIILLMLLLLPAGVLGEEMRGFVKGQGYQYVNLGEYPYEADGTVRPVLWRILSIDDGIALLHMENVIDVKQVIFETDPKVIEKHTFRRISSYAESDLFPWINSEMLDNLMGDNPLRGALVSDPELGTLRPLTKEEALTPAYGFSNNPWGEEINAHPDRQGVSTPYARSKGLYVERANGKSPWWCIAIKNPTDYKFGLVGHNGHISWGAYTNTKVAGGWRSGWTWPASGLPAGTVPETILSCWPARKKNRRLLSRKMQPVSLPHRLNRRIPRNPDRKPVSKRMNRLWMSPVQMSRLSNPRNPVPETQRSCPSSGIVPSAMDSGPSKPKTPIIPLWPGRDTAGLSPW